MPSKRQRQQGLTLLEPVIATALVGVLAAAVLPGLSGLSEQARATALHGTAAVATTVMYANHGACLVSAPGGPGVRCVVVSDCADVAAMLVGGLPAGYAVSPQSVPGRAGTETVCTLTETASGRSAAFQGIAAGG